MLAFVRGTCAPSVLGEGGPAVWLGGVRPVDVGLGNVGGSGVLGVALCSVGGVLPCVLCAVTSVVTMVEFRLAAEVLVSVTGADVTTVFCSGVVSATPATAFSGDVPLTALGSECT